MIYKLFWRYRSIPRNYKYVFEFIVKVVFLIFTIFNLCFTFQINTMRVSRTIKKRELQSGCINFN